MRPHLRFKTALIIPFALVVACSDPEPEDKPIILPDVDMTAPQDMAQDMPPVDMTMVPIDMPPDGPPREQEPNNTPLNANPIDLTKGVQGVIDEMTLTLVDKDVFSFEGKANTIINFEFISGPAFKSNGKRGLMADVRNTADTAYWYVLTDNSPGRSIYIPFDGTYLVTVQQLEAAFPDLGPPPPHGGPDAYYSLKTTVTDLAPTEPEPTFNKLSVGNNTDGEPDVYPFTLTEETHLTFLIRRDFSGPQLTASRAAIVNMQTRERVNQVSRPIAERDDNGWLQVDEYVLPPGDYVQVIDTQFNAAISEYTFMLRKQDGSFNDPVALGVDSPYQGSVSPSFVGDTYEDVDVFSFSLEPGEQTMITVTPEPGSEPVGALWSYIRQNNSRTFVTQAEASSDNTIRTSVYNADGPNAKRQEYVIRLGTPPDETRQPDKDYNYTISRTLVPATTNRLETKNIRNNNLMFMPGVPVWFEINVPKDHLWTLDFFQDSFIPVDYIFIRGDRAPFTYTGATVNRPARNQPASYLTTIDERVLIGVFPILWGYDSTEFLSRFKAVDLSGLTYTEVDAMVPHTTKATAFELDVSSPVLVKGNLPNMPNAPASDFYKVTLQAGQTISIITEPDPDPTLKHAPVELHIYNEADQLVGIQGGVFGDAPGDEVISFLTYGALFLDTYASLIFSAPADGTYTIELLGKGFTLEPGPYVLKVASATLDPLITDP